MNLWGMEGFEVDAAYNPMTGGLDVYVTRRWPDGIEVVDYPPPILTKVPLNEAIANHVKPTLMLDRRLVQLMADALGRQGVKAEPDSRLVGELAATKYHLEDMRALALKERGA